MTNQHDKEIREAFERDYKSGDQYSDFISLARDDKGEYEQALARVCYKYFKMGYKASAARYEAALMEAREALEAFQRGDAKIQVIVAEALTTINEILGEKK